MGILLEDKILDALYEEWEKHLEVEDISWELYVARAQVKNVIKWLGEFECATQIQDRQVFSVPLEDMAQLKKEAGIATPD